MMVFFRTRLGKISIWQEFSKRESPTLMTRLKYVQIDHGSTEVENMRSTKFFLG